MASNQGTSEMRHYFVDEAGDATLFNAKGRRIIGEDGCSRFFILGFLDIPNPNPLSNEICELRTRLCADPYLKNIPSMQPERKKTAIAFHAKDDAPEVRRDVYRLLSQHEMKFFAVVRDKAVIADKVASKNAKDPQYRYNGNQLYDRNVEELFKERLHIDKGYHIRFSRRGNKPRTKAIRKAIDKARAKFHKRRGIQGNAVIDIEALTPAQSAGLQAVDYFMWALQRLYERGEGRYWDFVIPQVSWVHDFDDTRNNGYGEYYSRRRPLQAECLKKR